MRKTMKQPLSDLVDLSHGTNSRSLFANSFIGSEGDEIKATKRERENLVNEPRKWHSYEHWSSEMRCGGQIVTYILLELG